MPRACSEDRFTRAYLHELRLATKAADHLSTSNDWTALQTARDFYDAGLMDLTTMRKFDALRLPEVPQYSPEQIKGIRMRCKASQAVFAKCINVSLSSLQKWEIGEKKPSNVALKLLNVVERKGFGALV